MASVSWIEYNGKRILFMDFANSEQADILKAIDLTVQITCREPEDSILGLLDTSNSKFDMTISSALKNMAKKDEPYMKVTAVAGIEGLKLVIFKAVLKFTGRSNIVLKDSCEEAKVWLASQL